MRRVRLSALLIGLIAVLALVAAGCGGSDDEGGSDVLREPRRQRACQGQAGRRSHLPRRCRRRLPRPGPELLHVRLPGALRRPTGRSTRSPPATTKPQPDLADGDPQISDDKKEITVKIKTGVKYAPPVDREVTSKDIKYAFERAFSANVPSGYATSYFADIDGAPAEPTKGVKPISGIETPDDQTLVFKLKRPVAESVAQALVMPITVPVPKEYAEKYDAKSPSEYDQYVAFTGPYMVKNDPKTGKVTGRDPGKRIEMVRNPNWNKDTDFRPAYLDSITIEEGNDDLTVASRRTLSATSPTMCCDSGQPPIPVLSRAITQNKEQLGRVSGGGTRWIALNTTKKPFDNINIRKGVIAGFDRDALRKTRGGDFIGPIAQGFIPPGIPGFEESGGEKGFDGIDYMANPKGDPTVMKKYFDAAEAGGRHPVGRRRAADHRHERGSGQPDRAGGAGPAQQDGLQAQLPQGPAGHAVHEVLRRPEVQLRDLPERGLVQGLHGSPVAPRADVQGRGHQAPGQRELEPAGQQGDQRRDDQGCARARGRRSATRRGPTSTR